MMKKISATLLMLLSCLGLYAQDNIAADSLYASDKIYVVVVCVVLILLGLIFFLFSMDRRLKKLERDA